MQIDEIQIRFGEANESFDVIFPINPSVYEKQVKYREDNKKSDVRSIEIFLFDFE